VRSTCRRKGSGACRGRWVGCSGVSHQVDGPLGGRLRRQSPFARKKLESYARALGERRPRLRAWQRAEGAVRIEVGKTLCARSCVHRAGRRYCSVVEHFVPYYRRRCCQFSNDQGWSRWQFDADVDVGWTILCAAKSAEPRNGHTYVGAWSDGSASDGHVQRSACLRANSRRCLRSTRRLGKAKVRHRPTHIRVLAPLSMNVWRIRTHMSMRIWPSPTFHPTGARTLAPLPMHVWSSPTYPVYRGANSRAHVNARPAKSHTSCLRGRELSRPCL